MSTVDRYLGFAHDEAHDSSPVYESLARGVAADATIIDALDMLPPAKRQPNLLFAACRYLRVDVRDTDATLDTMKVEWDSVRDVMMSHATQTNEPARTATFLPLLAQVDGPIGLIEVGASAGLCLFPDRYRVHYSGAPPLGPPDSSVVIRVRTSGPVPIPSVMPEVAWRAGCDLNPLSVRSSEDREWLLACIWPEHDERRDRLLDAFDSVRDDPPHLVAGDLVDCIDELLDAVPRGCTPVVFHSAVLNYVSAEGRREFARKVLSRPGVLWISNEGEGVVPDVSAPFGPPPSATNRSYFVVALNGHDGVAVSDPHGAWLRWI